MDMEMHDQTGKQGNLRGHGRIILETLLASASGFIISIIALFIIAGTYRYGSKTFWFLGRMLGRRRAEIVLVLFICVIGWLAHRFKQWQQGWYGLTKIVFGVVSATNIAFTMIPGSSTMPQWVGLFGSTYIIVRGLSNVSDVTSRNKNATLKASTAP
jgi:hypothetical protein